MSPDSKVVAENNDLRMDRERLLGVVRRYKAAGLSDAMAAHRDRLRKRRMPEREVPSCMCASNELM